MTNEQIAHAVQSMAVAAPTAATSSLVNTILALAMQYGPAVLDIVLPKLLSILFTNFPGSAAIVAELQALLASIKVPVTPAA